MAIIDIAPPPAPVAATDERTEGFWSKLRYYAAAHPLGVVGALIMLVFVFAALFAPWLTAYDPTATSPAVALKPPSAAAITSASTRSGTACNTSTMR